TGLQFPNGATRDVEIYYAPDLADDGSARGVILMSVDVTERTKAEAALLENERRFRHLVESTNAIPYSWDLAAGKYAYLAPQVERVLGQPLEVWRDKATWIELLHPDDRFRVLEHSAKFEANPCDSQMEYRIVNSLGKVTWVNDSFKLEKDHAGQLV